MSRNAPFPGGRARRLGAAMALSVAVHWLGAADLPLAAPHPSGTNPPPARVVIVQDPAATDLFRPRPDHVREMVIRGVTRLTGRSSEAAAWQSLVSTQDVVGLKVFCAPGPIVGTRPAVAAAVVEGLLAAGLSPDHIVVWDKNAGELAEAGFLEFRGRYGVRVEASATAGYDPKKFYENSLLGSLMWGDMEFGRTGEVVGRNSYVSKLVSRGMTKIINVSPLLNQNSAGVSGNLFSLAFGSVDNIRRFELDPQRMAAAIPEIYALPSLSDRVVLNIVDALLCQYQGGEQSMLHYSATLNELRFSRDPVALDILSIEELDRQRRRAGLPGQKPSLELYENASLLELGVCDPAKIQTEMVR